MTDTPAEHRLRVALRALAGGLGIAALVYAIGPMVGPSQDTFRELPFVANSTVKVSVLGLACLYAAGDIRGRLGLVALVIAAHLVSVSAMGILLAFGDTGRSVPLFSGSAEVGNLLWGAIALDGAITSALLVLWAAARRSAPRAHARAPIAHRQLTPPERWLRYLAIAFAALFLAGAAGYEAGPLIASTENLFVHLPFVTNSAVEVTALALLLLYVARDVRHNMALMGLVIAGFAISIITQLAFLALLDTDHALSVGDDEVVVGDLLWAGIAGGVIAVILFAVYMRAWTARYELKFLRPMEFRALLAAADVLVTGDDEQVTAECVARSMERYLRQMRARRRWVYRVALFAMELRPLTSLWPPLSELDPETRRHYMKTRFERPWLFPMWTRAAIRVCQQLSYAGYYNNPETFQSVGYERFTKRDRYKALPIPAPEPHPLAVEGASDAETDVCIVGSGAGGSILAYELAKRGHDVLVLERGEYVEPRHFTEDEVEMMGRLYADGVMQQTRDFRFTVLQGSCVGGSTTVNNAVSFRTPAPVLTRWNDEFGAGIETGKLNASLDAIEQFISVTPQTNTPLNPSASKFLEGVDELDLGPDELEVGVVRANIKDCFGSGYCNMGCAWGRKLSMLDTALPWAQRDFPGRVRVMADCEVVRIRALSGDPQRVIDVRARSREGLKVTIKARKFVLSAGAIGSSYVMMKSAAGRGLPVGKGLCFNMGAPLTAEFEEDLRAYDGLQISHYGLPPDNRFAYETWWNPPVAQAVNMPGWFERHYENMRAYNRLMAVGVLVGTEGNATVKKARMGGADIVYTPTAGDLAKMAKGLRLLAEILFAAKARRVMLNTWGYDEYHPGDDLDELERTVRRPNYMTLGTGHPQGGNAMSHDPRRGVVGSDFRVHGYENLYICDASVFPSSLTVNPQLTVMGLAHYAADRVSAGA